jgi:hypothetical protein
MREGGAMLMHIAFFFFIKYKVSGPWKHIYVYRHRDR